MPLNPKRVQAVFLKASWPWSHSAYWIPRCLPVAERIEALLRAHDRFNDFVNQPLVGPRWPSYAVIPRFEESYA